VSGARELLCCREAGGPGSDHGHAAAGLLRGGLWRDPAFGEAALDDGLLDELDGDRVVVDAEHAGGLAGGGADASRELGKVVRALQAAKGVLPLVAVREIVEVGNDVPERTGVVAERNSAVHAT